MADSEKGLPYSESDLVGPEDRPRPSWTLTMYDWQIYGNPTIKNWIDDSAGSVARAIHCASKPDLGVIYVRACDPLALKAHNLTISTDHRTVSWSLYTPLLAFNFPKVNDKHKAVFNCRPEVHGDVKLLVIEVSSYRVERVDKQTQHEAATQAAVAQAAAAQAATTPDSPAHPDTSPKAQP